MTDEEYGQECIVMAYVSGLAICNALADLSPVPYRRVSPAFHIRLLHFPVVGNVISTFSPGEGKAACGGKDAGCHSLAASQ